MAKYSKHDFRNKIKDQKKSNKKFNKPLKSKERKEDLYDVQSLESQRFS
jgi:hypothetical protein